MIAYFSKFGDVLNCKYVLNPLTGKSRGFAFITFRQEEPCQLCLSSKDHMINGKKVEVKMAINSNKSRSFVGGGRRQ
jgi:RNA recognition motif-containing protein